MLEICAIEMAFKALPVGRWYLTFRALVIVSIHRTDIVGIFGIDLSLVLWGTSRANLIQHYITDDG